MRHAQREIYYKLKKMKKALMADGMTDEQIMELETSSVVERGIGLGLDPDDYDPTYDREVRLAIRENERNFNL